MTAPAGITEAEASDLLINWEAARATAARLTPPGPPLSRAEAAAEVTAIRQAAAESVGHVHRITGITAAERLGEDLSDVLVVDRAGWAHANAEGFRHLLGPALKAAAERKPELIERAGSTAHLVGSSAAGAEFGAVLGFLSANVLGQFEPFSQQRLMLVAPNIVEIATELNVERDDFRLWVCLHEQTHRVQFAAAPWLAEHLREQITRLTVNTMGAADSLPERLAEAARQIREELATGGRRSARQRLLSAIRSPEDQQILSHITAVMSLLEGHANVVMDAVDASVVPSVKTIRRRFNDRQKHRSPLEKLIRKLLQLDVKAAQYRNGQSFVSQVVEQIGMEQFNTIWESAEHLPTEDEVHHPEQWIERMGFTPTRSSDG
ncbi:zinc-dependent metalloprotease [Nesterenkonia alba]|uniref:zinc-dependent metalloprotease n=1 Tax=Nesterenkonia alba TaxID=515814 RepID=UPI0003B688D5|nr:zinc-dependent metalloprotease [Nesterenkonia alba]